MDAEVKNEIIITDGARPYLEIQKGRLQHLAGNPAAWNLAYHASLANDLGHILPYLPARCDRILDIGGGMGGIDILLWRHYAKRTASIRRRTTSWIGPEICIVDGMEDPPVMELHRKTFSNAAVSQEFLRVNGVTSGVAHWSLTMTQRMVALPCDLIISLGAWCFHLPPDEYLDFVIRSCRPGTVLVLDVRYAKTEWKAQLEKAFEPIAAPASGQKWTRMVFRVR